MRSNVETDQLSEKLFAAVNVAEWCDLFRVEESTYVDPLFESYRSRSAIKQWLVDVTSRARWRSSGVGERYFDGFIVYRRDYDDTYELRQSVRAEYLASPGAGQ